MSRADRRTALQEDGRFQWDELEGLVVPVPQRKKSPSMDADKLIEWAEHETTEVEDFDEFEGDNDVTERPSGQLFNLIRLLESRCSSCTIAITTELRLGDD